MTSGYYVILREALLTPRLNIFPLLDCTWINSFNPDNNLEVGTAIIHILEMRKLKHNKVIN